MTGGFDRLRPRRLDEETSTTAPPRHDREGRHALFTPPAQAEPARGAVTVDCVACGERSVLGLAAVVRASVPGLHLPVLGRGRPRTRAYLRCPACRRRTWTTVTLRL